MMKCKENQYSLLEEIGEACNRVFTQVSQVNLDNVDPQRFLEITSSLACMGLLHRDLPWLLDEGKSQDLTPNLLAFCQVMVKYLVQYRKFMQSELKEKDSTAMGSRIVTYTEACADLARSLAVVVKVPFYVIAVSRTQVERNGYIWSSRWQIPLWRCCRPQNH